MKHILLVSLIGALVSGCAIVPERLQSKKTPTVGASVGEGTAAQSAQGQQRPKGRPSDGAGAVDAPDPADLEAALAGDANVVQPVAVGPLGTTIVSLGSPAEAGLWLKTPLAKVRTNGTVSYNGKTIEVMLIPIDGPDTAGSRMSLQAFQALGAALTDLVEVRVAI